MRVNDYVSVKKRHIQGRSRSGDSLRLQIMVYQLHGSYKKGDNNAFDSYWASNMGKSSPKEQD